MQDKAGTPMSHRQATFLSPVSSFFALETIFFGALVSMAMLRGFISSGSSRINSIVRRPLSSHAFLHLAMIRQTELAS